MSGVTASRRLDRLLVAVLLFAALAAVVVGIQLLVLLVLGRLPTGSERAVLAVSALAAVVAALVYQPLRAGLERFTGRLLPAGREPPGEMLRALSARLSRATPLDELLLELAESLRRGLRLESAEIWTGSGGLLERAASDPDRGWGSLTLAPSQEAVVARAGVSGPGWLAVWLPELLDSRGDGPLRVAPLVQADELLGLVVVERPPGGEPFGEQDERVFAELARQAGLALRNIRLDSQLRASLDEVRRQADEQLDVGHAGAAVASLGPHLEGGAGPADLQPGAPGRLAFEPDRVAAPGGDGDFTGKGVDLQALAPLHRNGGVDLLDEGRRRDGGRAQGGQHGSSFQLAAVTRVAACRRSSSFRRMVAARWELRYRLAESAATARRACAMARSIAARFCSSTRTVVVSSRPRPSLSTCSRSATARVIALGPGCRWPRR